MSLEVELFSKATSGRFLRGAFIVAAALLDCACTRRAETPEVPTSESAEPDLLPVTLPLADLVGNRMEALEQVGEGGLYCVGTKEWCVAQGEPPHVTQGASTAILPNGEGSAAIWPFIVRRAPIEGGVGGALVGVTQTVQQTYSGGGASVTMLTIYDVTQADPGLHVSAVATLPLSADCMIRACFHENDRIQRAGACHDEYTFVTRIRLDERVSSGAPRIVLETAARSFPGQVTRTGDSLQAPALQPSDLVWANDETCSYRRVFTRGSDGVYAPDQPLPACADYLEP